VRAAIEPAKSVFINCPFDANYAPLFDAIVFASACCGFIPRSALESGSVAEPRMERITRALFSSKYSIHDLSRCRGEGDDEHDWLVLAPEGHAYLRFLSDPAAYDLATHDGSVEGVVVTGSGMVVDA
jgi:hypothetical protein